MARLRRDGAFVGPDQAKRTWFAKTAIKQYEVQLRSSELVFSETRTGAELSVSPDSRPQCQDCRWLNGFNSLP